MTGRLRWLGASVPADPRELPCVRVSTKHSRRRAKKENDRLVHIRGGWLRESDYGTDP